MATVLNVLVCIICGVMLLTLACSPLYFKLGWLRFFYHDILKWHVPEDIRLIYGINVESICKYCGKEIIQDSQGNWF